jgi:hypothetical protein
LGVSVLDKAWTRTREINVPKAQAQEICNLLTRHDFKGRVCQVYLAAERREWQKIYFDGPPWLMLALHLCFGTSRAQEFGVELLVAVLEDKVALDTVVRLAPDEASWKKSVSQVVSDRLARAEADLLAMVKR